MRISDWSSDVCSSDLFAAQEPRDRDGDAQGAALRSRTAEARGGGVGRISGEDRDRLGPPDPFLCPPALSAREGSAHRRHLDRARRRPRRRARPLHGGGAVAEGDRRKGRGGGHRLMLRASIAALALLPLLGGCDAPWSDAGDRAETARELPAADRPVAPIVSPQWSTEESLDRDRKSGVYGNSVSVRVV